MLSPRSAIVRTMAAALAIAVSLVLGIVLARMLAPAPRPPPRSLDQVAQAPTNYAHVAPPTKEGFDLAGLAHGVVSGGTSGCYERAIRTTDGGVALQPNGPTFATVAAYATWLNGRYAAGGACDALPVLSAEDAAAAAALDATPATPYAMTPINSVDDYEWNRVTAPPGPAMSPAPAPLVTPGATSAGLTQAAVNTTPGNPSVASAPRKAAVIGGGGALNAALLARALSGVGNAPAEVTNATLAALTASGGSGSSGGQYADGGTDAEDVAQRSAAFFESSQGAGALPPDPQVTAAHEAALVREFSPLSAGDLAVAAAGPRTDATAQSLADEAWLSDPEWAPVVEHVRDNMWAVTGMRPKRGSQEVTDARARARRVAPMTLSAAAAAGADLAPGGIGAATNSDASGAAVLTDDPYFTKTGVADPSRDAYWSYTDFTTWTPTLERAFAPTHTLAGPWY